MTCYCLLSFSSSVGRYDVIDIGRLQDKRARAKEQLVGAKKHEAAMAELLKRKTESLKRGAPLSQIHHHHHTIIIITIIIITIIIIIISIIIPSPSYHHHHTITIIPSSSPYHHHHYHIIIMRGLTGYAM